MQRGTEEFFLGGWNVLKLNCGDSFINCMFTEFIQLYIIQKIIQLYKFPKTFQTVHVKYVNLLYVNYVHVK